MAVGDREEGLCNKFLSGPVLWIDWLLPARQSTSGKLSRDPSKGTFECNVVMRGIWQITCWFHPMAHSRMINKDNQRDVQRAGPLHTVCLASVSSWVQSQVWSRCVLYGTVRSLAQQRVSVSGTAVSRCCEDQMAATVGISPRHLHSCKILKIFLGPSVGCQSRCQ